MLSSGMKCYHLELMVSSLSNCYHLGWNVIIWSQCYHLGWNVIIGDAMLSSGSNVIIWDKMLSSGANVIMVSSGANVIIWCYHVMLSSGMITHPFLFFLKTSLTQIEGIRSRDENICRSSIISNRYFLYVHVPMKGRHWRTSSNHKEGYSKVGFQ